MNLHELIDTLHDSKGLTHKRDIEAVVKTLSLGAHSDIKVGDDCAAIPNPGGGYTLFAIEGFLPGFVERDPWFAGWCGIMVNLSDIYSMGGRPSAVVDALWSRGDETMHALLKGMADASRTYGVPIVGGHSNSRADSGHLAVSVLGHANALLTSFDAEAGDLLIAAVDLRGAYREPFPHWNCATDAPPERLRGDLELLPTLAEAGLCVAAKDISQAGWIGTTMMLLECSAIGASLNVDAIPKPLAADAQRWLLSAFPSFGFVLAVKPRHAKQVIARFHARDLACAVIGQCNDSRKLELRSGSDRAIAWDFSQQALIGCGPSVSNTHEKAHA
ncbi:sll0787 family AIR synthase-like protein [Hydrocarboniphaga effusa]|jgi:AIR synthase-related protein|uniref:sll0787 family AIR synthase-like protein n=1 Tax=Hydrocarboniphaga effusa TaxID=243629 RepID=UPI003BA98CCE